MRHVTIKLVVLTFIANFLLVNFVFAAGSCSDPNFFDRTSCEDAGYSWFETEGTGTDPNKIVINKAALAAAQASPQKCLEFSNNLSKATSGDWKGAFWYGYQARDSVKPDFSKGCYVVPGDWKTDKDSITRDNPADRYYGSYLLQDKINSSDKGLNSTDYQNAKTQDLADKTGSNPLSIAVGWILDSLLTVTAAFLGSIMALAGSIFSAAVYYILEVNTLPPSVDIGWKIVRDVCNMFFILVLIFIALATILRLKNYEEYGHLIRELVIMAVLVNFSQVIALTLMNLVNFLAAVFYGNGLGVDIFKTMVRIVNPTGDYSTIKQGGWMGALVLGLGKNIFMVVGTVVFIALAAMFVIRLVGLYVLIIFSPVAYVARILPATEKWAEEWWEKFIKYLIWAPVALFMIRLTIWITQTKSDEGWFAQGKNESSFYYFILCGFLAAALLVAEEAGMVGGKMIVGAVEKGAHWAGHTAFEASDRWLAKGATSGSGARRALSYLSVGAFQRGRKMALEHKEEEAYEEAAGIRADQYGRVFGGPGDFARLAQYQRVAQEKKRVENITDKDEKAAQAKHAFESGEYEKFFGIAASLAPQGDLNEAVLALGKTAGHQGWQEIVKEIATKSKNNEAYRMAADISKIAEDHGDYIFAGAFERKGNGEYGIRSEEDIRKYVNVQRAKQSDQQNIRNLNRRGLGFEESTEGDVWHTKGVQKHGLDYFSRLKNIQEWERNGNKNAKASISISASGDFLEANPQAWAVAANEYIDIKMQAETDGAGSLAAERLKELRDSVAAPNNERDYDARYQRAEREGKSVNVDQIKRFFEVKAPQIREGIAKGTDKEMMARYGHLYDYVYKTRTASSAPSGPATPPAPTAPAAGSTGPARPLSPPSPAGAPPPTP